MNLRYVQATVEENVEESYPRDILWKANPDIYQILVDTNGMDIARMRLRWYLDELERGLDSAGLKLHPLERITARDAIRTFKNILSPRSEKLTEHSALSYLWRLARRDESVEEEVSDGFLEEFRHLFMAVIGHSRIYDDAIPPAFLKLEGRAAAVERTKELDRMASEVQRHLRRYVTGLHPEVIELRRRNRERIQNHLQVDEETWNCWQWQLDHIIRDEKALELLVDLTEEEREAIRCACRNALPFGITPYYVSLMDPHTHRHQDHAIRAQVIPPTDYVEQMCALGEQRGMACDFMREHDTSPLDGITRRYPMIAVLKPYNSCFQICVYCQRNWEITQVLASDARLNQTKLDAAIDWIADHQELREILITGGDPLVLEDHAVEQFLHKLATIPHIERIRIGTRSLVVTPMRITSNLVRILADYHQPGRREICVVTHFQHVYEVTDAAQQATQRLRQAGISVYNQQVFTIENSRRFESVALRKVLRLIGVDPYYTFHMKGKDETHYYQVPIARLLQERKEEARLIPGLLRTDEPVFNVPKLGKSHLRSWQDHEVIMILPDGSRIYEFHPWEKNICQVDTYFHKDVPILEYLQTLKKRGEDIQDYRTIWYYY